MAGIEIAEHRGDCEDMLELAHRVWLPEYGGRMWLTLPDMTFLRRHLGPESGGRCIAAYHGTKLVGSIFSVPHFLRIGSSVHPIALIGGFTVDRDHRRLALPLVERLRRLHEERGIAFAIGSIANDPTSMSYRFWTKYAQTFPQNFRSLFPAGHWMKILAPRPLTRAGIKPWERLASRVLGPLLRLTPHRCDPHARPYRAGDLEGCAQLLDKASAGFDWALVWSAKQLARELESPGSETLVLERDGRIQAVARCSDLSLHGRQPVRAALIDLWADDRLAAGQRVRLLGHLCNRLRERDVHLVLALRCAVLPASAFVANLFLPPVHQMHVAALLTRPEVALAPPKTWRLLIM